MAILSPDIIKAYQATTYRATQSLQINTAEEAVNFVNERGFVFFWPIKGIEFPSLWVAAAGNRPVPDEHDDPGHKTWGWKDELLGQRRWYYGRTIRRRNAMTSLEILPSFYALSPNYGDPENDYLEQYEQGRLIPEAKTIYQVLLENGPLDTIGLRYRAHLSSPTSEGRFNRALDDLQMEFKVLPIGIAPVGAWKYAFIYEIATRHFPTLIHDAHGISEVMARINLARRYFLSVGATRIITLQRFFSWTPQDARKTIDHLISENFIQSGVEVTDSKDEWVALQSLVV